MNQKLIEKFGQEKAARMTKMLLKNYKRLAFINTGNYKIERYRETSKRIAKEFDLNFEEIEGSPSLVKKLINGPWDDEFVIVMPGQTLTYLDFVNPSPGGS